MHFVHLRIAAVLAAAVLAAVPARAQIGGVLRGNVVDEQTGAGVPLARVLVDDVATTHADDAGHFTVAGLTPGEHRVRLQRLGYRDAEMIAVLGDSLYVIVEMEPVAQALPGISVVEHGHSPAMVPERMRPFYWRLDRGIGGGVLLPRAALDSLGQTTLIAVLRRLPGARIIHAGAAMQDYLATGELPGPQALDHAPQPCYAQVFVDGVQLYVRGRGDPPDLNAYDLNEIEAIEYYARPSSTPIQFRTLNADCGTLVLWTRFAL